MGVLTRRVWLLVNLVVTVALVPALFTGGDGGAGDGPVRVSAGRTLRTVPVVATTGEVVLEPTAVVAEASTTTTTTAPPAPPTTAPAAPAPRPAIRSTTTTTTAAPAPRAPTTTTTAKPVPRPAPAPAPKPAPKPAPAPSAGATEAGKASWYEHVPGTCAHKTLPFGTIVTVTAVASGRTATCTVGDRGPFIAGWVIDLHPQEFSRLAPLSAGVIDVRLSW